MSTRPNRLIRFSSVYHKPGKPEPGKCGKTKAFQLKKQGRWKVYSFDGMEFVTETFEELVFREAAERQGAPTDE